MRKWKGGREWGRREGEGVCTEGEGVQREMVYRGQPHRGLLGIARGSFLSSKQSVACKLILPFSFTHRTVAGTNRGPTLPSGSPTANALARWTPACGPHHHAPERSRALLSRVTVTRGCVSRAARGRRWPVSRAATLARVTRGA